MKKILISVAALSLVVVMGVMLAACSTNPVGKWELYSISYDGETKKDGEEFDAMKEMMGTIELTEDGKVKMHDIEAGEWKQDGKKVTIAGAEYTISGSKLTAEREIEGKKMKVVFKKVK